jgi:hypothetical protein
MLLPIQASMPGFMPTVFRGAEMKKSTGSKKELDSCIESFKASQKNVTWPEVLRGGRSVDELLFKGGA